MLHPRKLLVLALVANLLLAGFVGAFHVHGHGEDCGSCRSVKMEEIPAHCPCGQEHDSQRGAEEPAEPAPTEHDDCPVCQLIATSWLPPAVSAVVELPAAVSPPRVETPQRPATAPTAIVRLRGPPAIG